MKIYNLFSLSPKTIVRYDLSLMLLTTDNSVNLSKNELLTLRSLLADAAAILLRRTPSCLTSRPAIAEIK